LDDDSGKKAGGSNEAYRLPGDMLTAHLLAQMKGWTGYGYELAKRLEESGVRDYNTGSLYRTLRQMEKHGLISSLWDTSESGPAKRMYTMTSGGTLFLRNWLRVVDMHKSMLEQFLDIEDPATADKKGEKPASGTRKRGKKAEQTSDTAGKAKQKTTGAPRTSTKSATGASKGKPTGAAVGRRKKTTRSSRDDTASDT